MVAKCTGIIPIILYWGVLKQTEGSYGKAAKSMGAVSVAAQLVTVACSVTFMGLGAYSGIMGFIK